jgi:hypothetical protein
MNSPAADIVKFTDGELKYLRSGGRFHPETGEPMGCVDVDVARRLVDTMHSLTKVFDREFSGAWDYEVAGDFGAIRVSVCGPKYLSRRWFSANVFRPTEADGQARVLKAIVAAAKQDWSDYMAFCRAAKRAKQLLTLHTAPL